MATECIILFLKVDLFSSAKKLLLEIELIKMEDTYIVIYIIFLLLYNIHFKW